MPVFLKPGCLLLSLESRCGLRCVTKIHLMGCTSRRAKAGWKLLNHCVLSTGQGRGAAPRPLVPGWSVPEPVLIPGCTPPWQKKKRDFGYVKVQYKSLSESRGSKHSCFSNSAPAVMDRPRLHKQYSTEY